MAESNILEIVQGLSQAAANAYDGSHDERFVRDGEVKKVGLHREEGCPIMDKRVMDGFKIKFYGNRVCIHYQADIKLKQIYAGNFESEMESMINKRITFVEFNSFEQTGKKSKFMNQHFEYLLPMKFSEISRTIADHVDDFYEVDRLWPGGNRARLTIEI